MNNNYNDKLRRECDEIKNNFTNDDIESALQELEDDFDSPKSDCAHAIYNAMDRLYNEFEGLHDDFCGIYIVFEDMSPILVG